MEILRRCRTAAEEIERMEIRIRQRRAAAGAGGATLSMDGGGGSGYGDRVGRIGAELADLEQQKEDREMALSVEVASACALMDLLPALESKILYGYWVEGKSTGEIARTEHFTQAYVRKKKRGGEMLLEMLGPDRVRETLPRWYLEKYPGVVERERKYAEVRG